METAREKLQAVRDALADSNVALERWERAKSGIEGTMARRFDVVGGDGNSVHYVASDALENYMQAEEELGEALNYWLDLLKEQQEQADKLPNSMEKLIINYRYLWPRLLTWPEIAAKVKLSEKQCCKLHKKALELMKNVSG